MAKGTSRRSFLILLVLLFGSIWIQFDVAHAGVGLKVLTGRRGATFKMEGASKTFLSGSESRVSLQLDVSPRKTIGFGLSIAQTVWKDDFQISGNDQEAEMEIWPPWSSSLLPYVSCSGVVGGKYVFQGESISGVAPNFIYKPNGYRAALGLRWQIATGFSFLVEMEKARRMLSLKSTADSSGSTPIPPSKIWLDSISLLLGFRLSI